MLRLPVHPLEVYCQSLFVEMKIEVVSRDCLERREVTVDDSFRQIGDIGELIIDRRHHFGFKFVEFDTFLRDYLSTGDVWFVDRAADLTH